MFAGLRSTEKLTNPEVTMTREQTDDLLDLTVTEKGFGNALLADNVETGGGGGSSSSCTASSSLCCSFHLCT